MGTKGNVAFPPNHASNAGMRLYIELAAAAAIVAAWIREHRAQRRMDAALRNWLR